MCLSLISLCLLFKLFLNPCYNETENNSHLLSLETLWELAFAPVNAHMQTINQPTTRKRMVE